MSSSDVVAVGRFRTKAHAQKAKTILDRAGIESIIRRDAMTIECLQDPTLKRYAAYNDQVQLMVKGEDVDKALNALQPSR